MLPTGWADPLPPLCAVPLLDELFAAGSLPGLLTCTQRGRQFSVFTLSDPKFTVILLCVDGITFTSKDRAVLPDFVNTLMLVSPIAFPITKITRGD